MKECMMMMKPIRLGRREGGMEGRRHCDARVLSDDENVWVRERK